MDIAYPQSGTAKKKILVDVAHGQRFWHDPDDMPGKDSALIARVKYMAAELTKNADALNATVAYQKTKFTPASLQDVDVLFLEGVAVKLDENETATIREFVHTNYPATFPSPFGMSFPQTDGPLPDW